MAWHYKAYQSDQASADRSQYAAAEIAAREADIGLWSDPNSYPALGLAQG
jgi:endonuclease YncB( thermonuclease family)